MTEKYIVDEENGTVINTRINEELIDVFDSCRKLNEQEARIQELQERIGRQAETISKQQEQIDNYIDVKSKVDAKIAEFNTKAEEYELRVCFCASKMYYYKKDALVEFKEEVFPC